MYSADAIEAINFEQLATATDRMLLRGALASKRRPGRPVVARSLQLPLIPLARGSEPTLPRPRIRIRAASLPNDSRGSSTPQLAPLHADSAQYEPTVVMPTATPSQVFAFTIVIPTLVGIAVGFAALL
jgi:hypothetical protein